MKAKKSLGQNFLRDQKIIEKIHLVVQPLSNEVILEVGPGEGVLTEKLAKSGATVIAVDLDDRLIPILKKRFLNYTNVHIVHGNILETNISDLLACYMLHATCYRIVGNLPYYITSAIIRMFLELENSPKEMFCMVQKEVAERIVASPREISIEGRTAQRISRGKPGKMSVLAVAVQYYAKPEILFNVPKEAFEPIPKVESAFIKIKPYNMSFPRRRESSSSYPGSPTKSGMTDTNHFFRIVKIGFSAKRKTLANNLANGLHRDRKEIEQILESLGLKKTTRAQELSVGDWKSLIESL